MESGFRKVYREGVTRRVCRITAARRPRAAPHTALTVTPNPCTQLSLAILRAGIIAQRVDYIMASHPGNNITALIMGVIGSCGGGMIVDAIDIGAGYSRGVSELGAPTYSLRSGLFMSIFHWLSVHRYGLLTSRESLGLITIFFVGQTLSACLFGIPLDYTRALGKLLHKVIRGVALGRRLKRCDSVWRLQEERYRTGGDFTRAHYP